MKVLYSCLVEIKDTLSQQFSHLAIFLGIILLTWTIQRYVLRYLFQRLIAHYDSLQMKFRKELLQQIEKPSKGLLGGTGFLIACSYALNENLFDYEPLLKIFKTLFLFFSFKAVYEVVNYFGNHPETLKAKFNLKVEDVLFPFFSRIVKVIVFIVAFAMIAYEWGYDINGFVTGLGIGGLAIALGAKDVLSHMFAGMAIAIDKPFSIGDWISTENNLEGIVEDINFRSTKIRTFDKALVSVPNAMIANQYIYNWTRRRNRRVRFFLKVSYSTTEDQIQKVIDKIKEMILNHDGVNKETVIVAFDGYNESSLDILIQYLTNTSELEEFIHIKEEINFGIMKILKEEGVTISIPSQNLYFETSMTSSYKKEA